MDCSRCFQMASIYAPKWQPAIVLEIDEVDGKSKHVVLHIVHMSPEGAAVEAAARHMDGGSTTAGLAFLLSALLLEAKPLKACTVVVDGKNRMGKVPLMVVRRAERGSGFGNLLRVFWNKLRCFFAAETECAACDRPVQIPEGKLLQRATTTTTAATAATRRQTNLQRGRLHTERP